MYAFTGTNAGGQQIFIRDSSTISEERVEQHGIPTRVINQEGKTVAQGFFYVDNKALNPAWLLTTFGEGIVQVKDSDTNTWVVLEVKH